jgi:hypothetical protein
MAYGRDFLRFLGGCPKDSPTRGKPSAGWVFQID